MRGHASELDRLRSELGHLSGVAYLLIPARLPHSTWMLTVTSRKESRIRVFYIQEQSSPDTSSYVTKDLGNLISSVFGWALMKFIKPPKNADEDTIRKASAKDHRIQVLIHARWQLFLAESVAVAIVKTKHMASDVGTGSRTATEAKQSTEQSFRAADADFYDRSLID